MVIYSSTIWSWNPSWPVYSHKAMGCIVMEAAKDIGDLGLPKNGHQRGEGVIAVKKAILVSRSSYIRFCGQPLYVKNNLWDTLKFAAGSMRTLSFCCHFVRDFLSTLFVKK